MRRNRFLVVSIPLMLCAATAVASPDVERIFAEHDSNGDGVITQAESRAGAVRDFRRLDTNGDGVLVAAEVALLWRRGRAHRAQGGSPAVEDRP